ncbi:CHAD domain-containing protein [Actinacidiphila alni]|uniref:CHAD domain-containing protein n=1 Tax=Actinacidiphila alni TaxID=380248 RepID=A0A1I2KR08_9ACTN|nr:CHAD domain-containing protein [Actinacidiphila alni]SFF69385.1 CHAD domain-containing protein [Actinacidiphila alni]
MAQQQLPDSPPLAPAGSGDPGPPAAGTGGPPTTTATGANALTGSAGATLARYLHDQATAFLRALSLRGEHETEADEQLRASARRIGGVLHIYAPLTDPAWAEPLRAELGWLAGTLAREPQYAGRLLRLLEALRRLSAAADPEAPDGASGGAGAGAGQGADAPSGEEAPATPAPSASSGNGAPLALGAARAGALLDRQLTLARTRAHSATLQAMGSSRFHALADSIAVLASEVPLTAAAESPAATVLPPLAAQADRRLAEAAGALPLLRAAHPYNAEAVQAALGTELTADLQDSPWHQVRVLLRLSRYAAEVCRGAGPDDEAAARRLSAAAELLARHREAAESAAAVAAAARTPRIAPATAYALGVLHADQRHEVEAARFAFSRLWQPDDRPEDPDDDQGDRGPRRSPVPGARKE